MNTFTFGRDPAKTGRPLGFVDVFSKLLETGIHSTTALLRARSTASRKTPNRDFAAAVAEASAVRRLADSQRKFSPGFAADLDAAADRHEWNRQI